MYKNFLFVFLFSMLISAVGSAQPVQSIKSGYWSDSTTWSTGVPPAPMADVVINDTVTYDMDSLVVNNLTVGNGTSGLWRTASFKPTILVIKGNLLVNSGAGFKTLSNTLNPAGNLEHLLYMHGNITNNGNNFDFRNGTTNSTLSVIKVIFSGNTNSVVTMNGAFTSSNGEYNAITINKEGNARVILTTDLYIAGGSTAAPLVNSILTFINGKVVTQGNSALIHQSTTAANVVGANNNSYVIGSMGRGMSSSGGSTKEFPVGDEQGYRPFSLRSTTAGSATGHYAKVTVLHENANTGSSTFPDGQIDKVSAVRYYKVTYSRGPAGAGSLSMTFDRTYPSYGLDDGVAEGNTNLRAAYSNDERVTWRTQMDSNPDTTTLQNPPNFLRPDSIGNQITLTEGPAFYVALARVTGTSENTLGQTSVTKTLSVANGWNLMSVPVKTANPLKTEIFPTATSSAFVYNNGYVVSDSLLPGPGFWLKFGASQNVNITGSLVTNKSIPVVAGWNIIGPFSTDVPVNGITTTPAGIITSSFFGFNNGYYTATQLASGTGYWIKVSQNGTINIPDAFLKDDNTAIKFPYINDASITLTDATGEQRILYLSDNYYTVNSYELPPLPPTGIFDVRFSTNNFLEKLSAENIISLNSAVFPVTITAKNCRIKLNDIISGTILNNELNNNEKIILSDSKINKIAVKGLSVIKEYELMQNYPNPFNPETVIKFAIPERARVNISIYDILGKKVQELADEILEPGYHQYKWNASDRSSGIYFVKMISGTKSFVKKMVVSK